MELKNLATDMMILKLLFGNKVKEFISKRFRDLRKVFYVEYTEGPFSEHLMIASYKNNRAKKCTWSPSIMSYFDKDAKCINDLKYFDRSRNVSGAVLILHTNKTIVNKLGNGNYMITKYTIESVELDRKELVKIRNGSNTDNDSTLVYYLKHWIVGPHAWKWFDHITSRRRRYMKKIKDMIEREFEEKTFNCSKRFMFNGKYSVSVQPLEKMVFSDKTQKEIIERISVFKRMRNIYFKYGINHRLGLLFYGPPGTGKTMLAYSIASEYEYNVSLITPDMVISHILDRDPCDGETYGDNTLYLFDEIDTFVGYSRNGVTITREHMLKQIDRIATGIVIATTNHIDKLDESIIRAGRFDIKHEFDLINKDLAFKMVDNFKLDHSVLENYAFPVAPAKLQFDCIEIKKKQIMERAQKSGLGTLREHRRPYGKKGVVYHNSEIQQKIPKLECVNDSEDEDE